MFNDLLDMERNSCVLVVSEKSAEVDQNIALISGILVDPSNAIMRITEFYASLSFNKKQCKNKASVKIQPDFLFTAHNNNTFSCSFSLPSFIPANCRHSE